jgi:hypothetical protein
MHKKYNPNYESVFGQFLFEGIFNESVDEDPEIKTVNQFILKRKTFKKAIEMS